ncbi:ATPase [Mesobaculum littorinae]|uniref:ATPase n=1 Tax=Mesobaculum littorinae TaxID=2486419 RepID=A0A438AEL3_9RHOB|nr:ATP12 family protein [Mesobaculum littorinae]RVV97108.1 ATPase [Mesobaculum littorinae]
MSEWAVKRFWTDVTVVEEVGLFGVRLDGRAVRTPAKAPLNVPTAAFADEIAAEWRAQEGVIRPDTMPATRAANAAIDKIAPQRAEVAQMLAAYGETDLLCHRADAPEALTRVQAEAWDPLLDWAHETYGARLMPTAGIVPVAQSPEALARLTAPVLALSPFALAPFHDLVALTGSLVMGLAAGRHAAAPEDLWTASRLDESWQADQWGHDEEAAATAEIKREAFLNAAKFFDLVGESV